MQRRSDASPPAADTAAPGRDELRALRVGPCFLLVAAPFEAVARDLGLLEAGSLERLLAEASGPEGRARTRHFSKDRPRVRHGEAGCEAETFAAIERICQISGSIGESMAGVSIAWLLAQPGVNAVLAGARKPDQIRETAQAADLVLAPETVDALTEATEEVKRLLGPSPDVWGGEAEGRFR